MKKKEWVYREVLYTTMELKEKKLTQLSLAQKLKISLSTVNNALRPLVKMGAVDATRMGFRVTDEEKLAAYWASIRNLEKDIKYQTRVDAPVSDIEKSMPSDVIYTAYSGYKFKFGDVPADYSEVYIYASPDMDEIKTRFPELKGPPNLFVLAADPQLARVSKGSIAPSCQLYVDLWNLKEWYAKDFLKALERRFGW
jgi:DNA-binding transcriptional regulator YhcF (GntR family)